MHNTKYAGVLLRKAAQDEFVIARLADDPDTPMEIIGFHAQQAVEKHLKAVLAWHGVRYRKTHDLVELIDLIVRQGIAFPDAIEACRHLTPFATEFRYDDLAETPEPPIDIEKLRVLLRESRSWAESIVSTIE